MSIQSILDPIPEYDHLSSDANHITCKRLSLLIDHAAVNDVDTCAVHKNLSLAGPPSSRLCGPSAAVVDSST
ncbi:hypothetical protein TNCV_2124831 [Trichonephila clavipes]|nr:hypothetical protein TNCV_2124831 [Trichonephila clavipes]